VDDQRLGLWDGSGLETGPILPFFNGKTGAFNHQQFVGPGFFKTRTWSFFLITEFPVCPFFCSI
jgi:hypothetical protein